MSLTQLWHLSGDQLSDKHVQQIIAIAGDGKLRDGTAASVEFRDFLSQVPSRVLRRYAEECLAASFIDSGLALQDIINQVGKRLGFDVRDGRYKGIKGENGYDGLWRFPNGHIVIVEVKTTDSFRIDTGRIAEYRKQLIATGEVNEEQSSVLIIVGRDDTGGLEAQIRGSRHAWDIRLISVDALVRLMLLKESVDDPQIISRICSILIPREFTRLDEIIEIVFFTTEEAKQAPLIEDLAEAEGQSELSDKTVARPSAFHEACIERFCQSFNIRLVRRSRTSYTTADGSYAVICAVSKAHEIRKQPSYWFAFHPHYKDFLEKAPNSFLVLGCGSRDAILAIPFRNVAAWLNDLWVTQLEDRMYWHIRLQREKGKFYLDRKKGLGKLDLTPFLLLVGGQ